MPQAIHFFGDEHIKRCPRCHKTTVGPRSTILKIFGRNRSRADGFTVECRECRAREYRARRNLPKVDKPDLIVV